MQLFGVTFSFCCLNSKQKKREIHKLNYLKQTFSNPMVYLYSSFKFGKMCEYQNNFSMRWKFF